MKMIIYCYLSIFYNIYFILIINLNSGNNNMDIIIMDIFRSKIMGKYMKIYVDICIHIS